MGIARFSDDFKRDAVQPLSDSDLPLRISSSLN